MPERDLIPSTEILAWEAEAFAEVLLALSPFDAQLRGFKDEDFNLLAWVEETMIPMNPNSSGEWEHSLTVPDHCEQLESVVDFLVNVGLLNTSDYPIDDDVMVINETEAIWQINVYASTRRLSLLADASKANEIIQNLHDLEETGFRKVFVDILRKGLTQFLNLNQGCLHQFQPNQLDEFDQECINCSRHVWDPALYKEIYG